MRHFLGETGKSMAALDRADRISLLARLDKAGLFQTRNATPFIAQTLGVSRATVYGLLAAARRSHAPKTTSKPKRVKS
ncbi:helix-turn-helix domain-containing protein [Dongia soli]|uniref:helix-turn-helix domain-containing protein n=1 Tax=Dongia soli TaxID=600628 RepID=UPI00361F927B